MPSTEMRYTECSVSIRYEQGTAQGAVPVTAEVFALDEQEARTGAAATAVVWKIPTDCDTTSELLQVADEFGGNFYELAERLVEEDIAIEECTGIGTLVVEDVQFSGPDDNADTAFALQRHALALALDAAGARFGLNLLVADSVVDDKVLGSLAFEKRDSVWYADSCTIDVDAAIRETIDNVYYGIVEV